VATLTVAATPSTSANDHPLLQAMGFDPVALDTLSVQCNEDINSLSSQLLALELDGLIEMLPGGLYRRVA